MKTEPRIDLSQVPEELYGKWIAVDKQDSSVIAHADTMKEAADKAEQKTSHDFVITMVTPNTGGFLLTATLC